MNTKQNIAIDRLCKYIDSNEVVYQEFGGLIELANENETENRTLLKGFVKQTSSVGKYNKDHWFIKDDFKELNSWSTENDYLFLLEPIMIMIMTTMNLMKE